MMMSLASQPSPRHGRRSLLINPFPQLTGSARAKLIGLVFAAQLLLTRGGVVFEGALDVHNVGAPLLWRWSIAQLVVTMVLPALLLTALARLLGGRAKLLDMMAVVAAARIPLTLPALLSLASEQEATLLTSPWQLAVMALLTLGAQAWMLALLYRGVRWAGELSGARVWLTYLLGAVLSETATWLLIDSWTG